MATPEVIAEQQALVGINADYKEKFGFHDEETCTVECPRHGSRFDLRSGKPVNLPAYVPVDTFPVSVADGVIKIEVD